VDVVAAQRTRIPLQVPRLRGHVGVDSEGRKPRDDLVDVPADPAPVRRHGGRVDEDAHHW
jgi:hypothetical protein